MENNNIQNLSNIFGIKLEDEVKKKEIRKLRK